MGNFESQKTKARRTKTSVTINLQDETGCRIGPSYDDSNTIKVTGRLLEKINFSIANPNPAPGRKNSKNGFNRTIKIQLKMKSLFKNSIYIFSENIPTPTIEHLSPDFLFLSSKKIMETSNLFHEL